MARTKRQVKPLPTIWEVSDDLWQQIESILAQRGRAGQAFRRKADPRE